MCRLTEAEVVLTTNSAYNLIFKQNKKTNVYMCIPKFYYISKLGLSGLNYMGLLGQSFFIFRFTDLPDPIFEN